VPVFFIGRRLRGDACGLLAALLFAITPALVFWTASVFSEPLFTLGVAATIALAMHAGDRGTMRWSFATGVLLIATAFVRSQGVLLIVPVAVLLVRSRDAREAMRALAPVAVAVAIFVVPWAIRNQAVMGEPYLINGNLGYNLRLAHAPYSTGTSVPPQDVWD
jgi:4-amino-4-deoxy-L-arabinose transferase-like glycosyltransferase